MKALTLYQPWATLWALQEKINETRSWTTKYRGRLAVHAAKKQPLWARELERTPFFKEVLYPNGNYLYPWRYCGWIIAICDLIDIIPITEKLVSGLSEKEKVFGDYSLEKQRWAWIPKNMKLLDRPILVKGAMGLWEWDEKI